MSFWRLSRSGRILSSAPLHFEHLCSNLTSEGNGPRYGVRFPDFPEALTIGADRQDACIHGEDCLAEAIAVRIARGDAIPTPSRLKRWQNLIGVPLYLAPKLAIYLVMRDGGFRGTKP